MQLIKDLLQDLPEGIITDIRVGLHWTAVVVGTRTARRCGLASTLSGSHDHRSIPYVSEAGYIINQSACMIASWSLRDTPVLPSIGMAALNALLHPYPASCFEANAEEMIASRGAGKHVALVGHFPFADRLRSRVGKLSILEQDPLPGDFPAEMAPQIIPDADVIAITGMAIVNHTLENLLHYCSPDAYTMLIGPSTPMSQKCFNYRIDFLSGAVVVDIEQVLQTVSQGGNFRQVHKAGVRLVNLAR